MYTTAVESVSDVSCFTGTGEVTIRVIADRLNATSAVVCCTLVDICSNQPINQSFYCFSQSIDRLFKADH